MKRYNITVGAKTTVGGTVRTGYQYSTIENQAMAREGDEVYCPKCDSIGVIVLDGPHLVDERWTAARLPWTTISADANATRHPG